MAAILAAIQAPPSEGWDTADSRRPPIPSYHAYNGTEVTQCNKMMSNCTTTVRRPTQHSSTHPKGTPLPTGGVAIHECTGVCGSCSTQCVHSSRRRLGNESHTPTPDQYWRTMSPIHNAHNRQQTVSDNGQCCAHTRGQSPREANPADNTGHHKKECQCSK